MLETATREGVLDTLTAPVLSTWVDVHRHAGYILLALLYMYARRVGPQGTCDVLRLLLSMFWFGLGPVWSRGTHVCTQGTQGLRRDLSSLRCPGRRRDALFMYSCHPRLNELIHCLATFPQASALSSYTRMRIRVNDVTVPAQSLNPKYE